VRTGRYPGPLLLQPYCDPLVKGFIQAAHGIASQAAHEVRVGVHRLGNGRVSEKRLGDLRDNPLRVEGAPEGMTQEAVEGETIQPCLHQRCAEPCSNPDKYPEL
jgi:hypothetical protein